MNPMGINASAGGIVEWPSGNDGTREEGGGGGNRPCGACKFLRRKCMNNCIFAPHFDLGQGVTNFEAVHKVFGASHASRLLHQIPPHMRPDAVLSICYEARARHNDPIYGCTYEILALQEQVMNLQAELTNMQISIANMALPTQPTFVAQPQMSMIEVLPLYNMPSPSNILHTQVQWAPQQQEAQQQLHQQQFVDGGDSDITTDSDLQVLACELLNDWVG